MAGPLTWIGLQMEIMDQYETIALIAEKIPDAGEDLAFVSVTGNIYKAVDLLSNYTKKLVCLRQFTNAQRCMVLADTLYTQGNAIVKNAIATIYVYSFSGLSLCCDTSDWKMVQAAIPRRLYALYINQLIQSAC